MRNLNLKLIYLGLAILVIAACGGSGGGDNNVTKVVPVNLINDSATGVVFHVNSLIMSVQPHFQHGNSITLSYPPGSVGTNATQTVNVTVTDGMGHTIGTDSTTVGVNETINNLDIDWTGATLTITKE